MQRRRFLKILTASGIVVVGLPISSLGRTLERDEIDPGTITSQPFAKRLPRKGPTLFTLMPPETTGIVTSNPYDDPRMWGDLYNENENGEIGTGVAIGDYDNDGRPDIFVVSKTRSCRLFRNLGDWKFEDVTEKAGLLQKGDDAKIWKQGATFVDINNNGLLDIYVCRFGAPNLLYINQGDGTFREEAAARGVAISDASVMAAFCDFDRDGSIDLFLQTNVLDANGHPNGQRNYLFRNKGDGTFEDVTARSGISGEARGHSAVWWDFDGDGWPDLYVANDFAEPDKLYRNNRDGTFTNVIDTVVPHMPYSAMGSDLGDVNNDGLIDLFVAEMAPTSRQKDQRTVAVMRSFAKDPPDGSTQAPQYMRNALYINTGTGRCLEAACLAGIAATDWTWSVRLEDLDLDGRLDLFVTNGMNRETHNADLIARRETAPSPTERILAGKNSPVLNERHLAFRNLGDLKFEDVSDAWGLGLKGVSFGAAFGDLDDDGDLDLVFTNYEGGVTVMRNDCDSGHSVIVALRGKKSNRYGVGATVKIETASGLQVRNLVLGRGLLSSSEPVLHFGTGEDTKIARLTVSWPSGYTQIFSDLDVDARYVITEPSVSMATLATPASVPKLLSEISAPCGFSLSVTEAPVDELIEQPLLPMRQNRRGPAIAVGDVDDDGRDDIFLGGTSQNPARILRQAQAGRFEPVLGQIPARGSVLNDGPALLLDVGGRGFCDLIVTSSGNSLAAGAPDYQPRLFFNDGKGAFVPASPEMLPPFPISVGALAAADFDRSGRLGLFIGGRVVPGRYPAPPQSALWANRGGRFEDVTDQIAPGLKNIGMVTSALWCDVDGDGWPDLLLTLEWGQVRYFHNAQGKQLEDWSERAGFLTAGKGWWTSITVAHYTREGRPNFVVGNVGLNTTYQASAKSPAVLLVGDFSGSGESHLIECVNEGGRLYPRRSRKEIGAAIPSLLRRFPRNDVFARMSVDELFGAAKVAAAERYEATEFQSGIFRGKEDGTYAFEPLPRIAQISPIQGLLSADLDGDGLPEICAVQNSFSPVPSTGRFDGGLGQMIRIDESGTLHAVPALSSGLIVPGDAKALALIELGSGRPALLVSRNNSSTLAFDTQNAIGAKNLCVRLKGKSGNPCGVGARICGIRASGKRQWDEIRVGSGYFSQSSASVFLGSTALDPIRTIEVRWPNGSVSRHDIDPSVATVALPSPA